MSTTSDWKVKTKRYVAFLDILGFKEFVLRHSIHEVYSRLKILNALKPDIDEADYDSELEKRIMFTIMSDSIFIFSKDDTFSNLRYFLTYVKRVMRMAIRKEIPLKGAIAYGTIAVDNEQNLFCGQPIIDAYLLEEDLQYMGVVFHHTFEDPYEKLSDTQYNRISGWIKEVPTPFKYGKRIHLNLNYPVAGSKIYKFSEKVENQRFYSSGDARKYVDNTLEMLILFETHDNKKE
jgi:hypothetical protein